MKRLWAATLCAAVLGTGMMATPARAQNAEAVTAALSVAESTFYDQRRIDYSLLEYERPREVSFKMPQTEKKSRFMAAMEDELHDELAKVDEDAFRLSAYRFEINRASSLAFHGHYHPFSLIERFGQDAAREIAGAAGPDAGIAALPTIDYWVRRADEKKDEIRAKRATIKNDRWSFSPDVDAGDDWLLLEGRYKIREGYDITGILSAEKFEIGAPLQAPEDFASKMRRKFGNTPVLRHLAELVEKPIYVKGIHDMSTGKQTVFVGYRALFD